MSSRKEENLEIRLDKVREMLVFKCWRVEDLAIAAGVSYNTASRIVNGVTFPRPATLAKICKALDCTALDIVKLKGE